MRDRGETSRVRTTPTTTLTMLAATALAVGVLVAAPSESTSAATVSPAAALGSLVPSAAGTAPASVLTGRLETAPRFVTPEVTKTRIPAVVASATLPDGPAVPAGEDDTAQLAAHVRLARVAPFTMLGVTWARDTGDHATALVRTRSAAGWSDWSELHVDADEGPTGHDASGARDGTPVLWVGDAGGVEVAVYSESGAAPRDLSLSTIDPAQSSYDPAATATQAEQARPRPGTFPTMPTIITRRQWGADPKLGDKCWPPRYGTTFKNVFVHHTVTSNDYDESESASIVRGIYAYHTQSRGWCDIGYNFLVDRYGNIFEGRRGGMRLPVRGAHAGDYNTNSTGISLLGNFDEARPTRRMKGALVRLVAWRMGTAYHGAYGRAFIHDSWFKRISGHRDAMATACPGAYAYDWLPALRQRVQVRLGDFESKLETRWRHLGGGRGWLGPVRIGERGLAGGHYTIFRSGRMYASEHGVFAFEQTAVLREFRRHGGITGGYGYPKSSEVNTRNDRGTFAAFEGGRVWWSNETGAHGIVNGAIANRYRRLDAASGRLGFPDSPRFRTRTGTRVNFENGYIARSRSTGKTTVVFR
jgi:N-acetylmuramoyl-L-alanine amidase/LGFP repeat